MYALYSYVEGKNRPFAAGGRVIFPFHIEISLCNANFRKKISVS